MDSQQRANTGLFVAIDADREAATAAHVQVEDPRFDEIPDPRLTSLSVLNKETAKAMAIVCRKLQQIDGFQQQRLVLQRELGSLAAAIARDDTSAVEESERHVERLVGEFVTFIAEVEPDYIKAKTLPRDHVALMRPDDDDAPPERAAPPERGQKRMTPTTTKFTKGEVQNCGCDG